MTIRIGEPALDFALQAYRRGEEEDPVAVTLQDFRGDWLLVFFYPADFTFVCPTELEALAALEERFHAAGASIVAASTDSWFSHRAWFETDPRLASVRYPVVADQPQKLSSQFGVLQEDGTALRGSVLIDPDGIVRHASVTDSSVGRAATSCFASCKCSKQPSCAPWAGSPANPHSGSRCRPLGMRTPTRSDAAVRHLGRERVAAAGGDVRVGSHAVGQLATGVRSGSLGHEATATTTGWTDSVDPAKPTEVTNA